jgi:hypothetical protein
MLPLTFALTRPMTGFGFLTLDGDVEADVRAVLTLLVACCLLRVPSDKLALVSIRSTSRRLPSVRERLTCCKKFLVSAGIAW